MGVNSPGSLLCMMARDAIERRFGVQFAFQNRHRAGWSCVCCGLG
ncbi:MAG TPA: hypothetical protein VF223_12570 [Trebonia sp.]